MILFLAFLGWVISRWEISEISRQQNRALVALDNYARNYEWYRLLVIREKWDTAAMVFEAVFLTLFLFKVTA